MRQKKAGPRWLEGRAWAPDCGSGWPHVVTGIKIVTMSKEGCCMVIQKDIEVTQDLGLDIKTLTYARVFVRCGGLPGNGAVCREKWRNSRTV